MKYFLLIILVSCSTTGQHIKYYRYPKDNIQEVSYVLDDLKISREKARNNALQAAILSCGYQIFRYKDEGLMKTTLGTEKIIRYHCEGAITDE